MPEKTGQAEFSITSKTPECLAVTGEQKLLITVTEYGRGCSSSGMLTFHGRDSPLTLKILQHARLSQTEVHRPCRSVLHAAAITLNLLHMSIQLHCLTSQSNFPSLRMVGTACCFLQKINPRYIAAHGMLVFLMPMRPIRLHCG